METRPEDVLAEIERLQQRALSWTDHERGSRGAPASSHAPWHPRRDQEAIRRWGSSDDTSPAAASARERAKFGRLASSNVRRTSIRCWRSALTRMAPAAIRTPAMTGRMRRMTYRPMSTSLEPSSGAPAAVRACGHATARGGVPPQYGPADRGRLLDFGLPRRARLYDGGHAWRSTTTRASDGGQAIIDELTERRGAIQGT
jgi:hypothetical protein